MLLFFEKNGFISSCFTNTTFNNESLMMINKTLGACLKTDADKFIDDA